MGISARYIAELAKTHGVVEHVIIEANEQVFEKLKEHAAKYSDDNFKVTPVFGFWEEVTSTFVSESFDGILFDPYVFLRICAKHFSPLTKDSNLLVIRLILPKRLTRATVLYSKATVCLKMEVD